MKKNFIQLFGYKIGIKYCLGYLLRYTFLKLYSSICLIKICQAIYYVKQCIASMDWPGDL